MTNPTQDSNAFLDEKALEFIANKMFFSSQALPQEYQATHIENINSNTIDAKDALTMYVDPKHTGMGQTPNSAMTNKPLVSHQIQSPFDAKHPPTSFIETSNKQNNLINPDIEGLKNVQATDPFVHHIQEIKYPDTYTTNVLSSSKEQAVPPSFIPIALHQTPPSFSGIGISGSNNMPQANSVNSPQDISYLSTIDNIAPQTPIIHSLGNTDSMLPIQPHITNDINSTLIDPTVYTGLGMGNIPTSSMGGAGISPSNIQSFSPFIGVEDKIPNHTQPFGMGNIPSSLANVNAFSTAHPTQPNTKENPYQDIINIVANPKESVQQPNILPTDAFSYPTYLENILASIPTQIHTAQLPSQEHIPQDPSYYFHTPSVVFPHASKKEIINPLLQQNTTSINNGTLDINKIKNDFPILKEKINGRPLVWLDNAATTQKPKQVIDRIKYFYEHENSNVHRAAHNLAKRATEAYENARKTVQHFIHAPSLNEIVFVRGTTEAINLVAKTWGQQNLEKGDEIIISHLEHHANIVPWFQLAETKGLKIKVAPVDETGQIILEEYGKLLGPKVKLVSFTQVSNALGTITPAKEMIDMAHQAGAKVLLDGAQSVLHMAVDVTYLDCDWFVFSGHKIFAPTGIGILYGKEEILNSMQPWQGGGHMIKDVTFERIIYNNAPTRFEAGTGNIADAVGLAAALDYVSKIGLPLIEQYEHYLLMYAMNQMNRIPDIRFIGTATHKASVISFVLKGFTTEEIGQAMDKEGIAVRSSHHCAQPILRRFGVETTVRPSITLYNTCDDIDKMVEVLFQLIQSKK